MCGLFRTATLAFCLIGVVISAPTKSYMEDILKKMIQEEEASLPQEQNGISNFPNSDYQPPRKEFGNSAVRKRNVAFDKQEESCEDLEWFVFIGNMPACVAPLWQIGYDPTYCNKMKNGWVYCGCDTNFTPGMAEGIDTCIDKAEANSSGRCHLLPCPSDFSCEETMPGLRFDCVKADVVVPTWYNTQDKQTLE
ncbi:uncharacterized protein LOC100181456 [Ciona intestinalis]